MYSTKDFEKCLVSKSRRKLDFIMPSAARYYENLFLRYKVEGIPKGESIESFCMRNNVPSNLYFKWYRDTRKTISLVKIEGKPETEEEKKKETVEKKENSYVARHSFSAVRRLIPNLAPALITIKT